MRRSHKQADAGTLKGVGKALNQAWGLGDRPLLIDAAADAAFAGSIERLRGEPGSNNGGKQ